LKIIGISKNLLYCKICPTGKYLSLFGIDSYFKIYLFNASLDSISVLNIRSRVTDVQWAPKRKSISTNNQINLLTKGSDSKIRLWCVSGECLGTIINEKEKIVKSLFHPFARHIITLSGKSRITQWDLESFRFSQNQGFASQKIIDFDINNMGDVLAFNKNGSTINLFDFKTGFPIINIITKHDAINIKFLKFVGTKNSFIFVQKKRLLSKCNFINANSTLQIKLHKKTINSLSIASTTEKYFSTTSLNQDLKVWCAEKFHCKYKYINKNYKLISSTIGRIYTNIITAYLGSNSELCIIKLN